MAVYQRSFRPFAGPHTDARLRFLVPARYALQDLLKSKLFVVFLTLCLVYPLISAVVIYVRHNADLLEALAAMGAEVGGFVPIDERFFGIFMRVQGLLAFFLVLFSGPRLVSRDLANNGLALYLCRPFSKTQYVAGKLTVLALLCSLVTWIPGLVLWGFQAGLEGSAWGFANLRSAMALFVGSWIWILVLGFLALAISAWVKWRPVAGFCLLLVYFGGSFFSRMIEVLFRSEWGWVLDLDYNMHRVWAELFGTTSPFFFIRAPDLPVWPPVVALAVLTGLCLLALGRRIRAYEVVS